MRVTAIVQARVGSTRLPGKALLDIEGQTMLERVVRRVQQSKLAWMIIVATSTDKKDDEIERLCHRKGWLCYRGSEDDVLDRFCRAIELYKIDVVVRITGDCPLVDPRLIDQVIRKFLALYPYIDYVSNTLPPSFPRGLDVEVVQADVLKNENLICIKGREHVTQGIRKNPNGWYRIANLASKTDYSYMRWCVDTTEDLEFVWKVYRHFGDMDFGWRDVVNLLKVHPDWVIVDKQKEPA